MLLSTFDGSQGKLKDFLRNRFEAKSIQNIYMYMNMYMIYGI